MHLAVVYNPENKSKPGDFLQTREAAISLGISVDGFQVRDPEDIQRIFASFAIARDGETTCFQGHLLLDVYILFGLRASHIRLVTVFNLVDARGPAMCEEALRFDEHARNLRMGAFDAPLDVAHCLLDGGG